MALSKNKINKHKDLIQWKRKWGLLNYKIFVNDNMIFIVCSNFLRITDYYYKYTNELKTVSTIVKRLKNARVIYIRGDINNVNNKIEFNNIDELKEYCLIKKLAGV
jgi:hypothetical protein